MHRLALAALLLIASTVVQAATTYRVTITRKDGFKLPPVVQRVIADGQNRRLAVEHPEEPYTFDVLLSTDAGKSVTALNTGLRTWYDFAPTPATETGLPPSMKVEIKNAKASVAEEPSTETMAGFPVRKFVIRAGYTTREDYSGTKVNRVHVMTTLLWTTDKLDGSLAFPIPVISIGVRSLDAELRQKTASISGFLLREVTTISRTYEGGAPSIEMTTLNVDDIQTVPSPPASEFAKPPGYVHQEPVIGVPGK